MEPAIRRDAQAQPVLVRLAVVQPAGGLHRLQHARVADLRRVEVLVPSRQVLDRRLNCAVAGLIPVRHVDAESARARRVRRRALWYDTGRVVEVLRARHAEWLEDPPAGERRQRLARRALHDDRREEEAGIAVTPLLARREIDAALPRDEIECVAI